MVVGVALSTLNIHSDLQLFLGKVSMMINWNSKCKMQNGKKIDNWNPSPTVVLVKQYAYSSIVLSRLFPVKYSYVLLPL